jgi:uridylate kinase
MKGVSMGPRPEIGRILLKVSGEVFGSPEMSIDLPRVEKFADEIRLAIEKGVQMAIVPGGGNILRGAVLSGELEDRVSCDYMGMLATVINSLALQGALEAKGVETVVMTPFTVDQVTEKFGRRAAVSHLENGRIIILAGGTGNPFFTTDTAAALRAAEVGADVLLKGTKVDGVYDKDPKTDPGAQKRDELTFTDILKDDLKVMDATAVALCRDNGIPIIVFDIMSSGNLRRVVEGDTVGTVVQ